MAGQQTVPEEPVAQVGQQVQAGAGGEAAPHLSTSASVTFISAASARSAGPGTALFESYASTTPFVTGTVLDVSGGLALARG